MCLGSPGTGPAIPDLPRAEARGRASQGVFMSKELVISAASHERRVAILEEGQLVEIYIEREKEFALVGSIYKGRVTRVLPGMQSAFVDIGWTATRFCTSATSLRTSRITITIMVTDRKRHRRFRRPLPWLRPCRASLSQTRTAPMSLLH